MIKKIFLTTLLASTITANAKAEDPMWEKAAWVQLHGVVYDLATRELIISTDQQFSCNLAGLELSKVDRTPANQITRGVSFELLVAPFPTEINCRDNFIRISAPLVAAGTTVTIYGADGTSIQYVEPLLRNVEAE